MIFELVFSHDKNF